MHTLTLLKSSFSLGVIFLSDWNIWTAVLVAEIKEHLCRYKKAENWDREALCKWISTLLKTHKEIMYGIGVLVDFAQLEITHRHTFVKRQV